MSAQIFLPKLQNEFWQKVADLGIFKNRCRGKVRSKSFLQFELSVTQKFVKVAS